MKIKALTYLILLAVVGGGWSSPALAQEGEGDQRAGTAAAEYLLIPLNARTASLGSTLTGGMANLGGVEALQANPAGLMANTGTNAQFSRMEYAADIGVNYFGVGQRFGNNNVALTVSFWDFGDIPLQDESSPEISDLTFSASNVAVGLTLARQFTDRINAGFTVKGMNESIDDMNASGVAFDAGMTYVVGESGLRFGVSLKNFGPAMTFGGTGLAASVATGDDPEDNVEVPAEISALESELPSLLNFGATYTRQFAGDVSVSALANFRSRAYDLDQYSVGLEAGYANLFFVRGGAEITSEMDLSFYQGWNVGAGLNLELSSMRLNVDYAYRGTEYFSGVNLFTVGFTL
jgi:hypothetical protein